MSAKLWAGAWRCLLATSLLCTPGCDDDDDDEGGTGAASATGGSSATGGAGATGSGAGGSGGAGAGAGGNGAAGTGGGTLWQPDQQTTWQWQLADYPVDLTFDVDVYDVDLVDASDQTLEALRSAGRAVICYFSAGSWESYRPDAGQFSESVKGDPLDPPFDDELWLDIRTGEVRSLIAARLDLAVSRGCDAVEPDNVDGYANNNGFNLSAADQLDYNAWIAAEAHARGLSVGLKNDVDQLDALEPSFDWALNEECFAYDECDAYADNFLAAGKAVFHAEYVDASELGAVCAVTKPLGIATLVKNIELDAFRLACP